MPLIPNRFGLDPICDVQVVCPMNRGGVGVMQIENDYDKEAYDAGPGLCCDHPQGARLGVPRH